MPKSATCQASEWNRLEVCELLSLRAIRDTVAPNLNSDCSDTIIYSFKFDRYSQDHIVFMVSANLCIGSNEVLPRVSSCRSWQTPGSNGNVANRPVGCDRPAAQTSSTLFQSPIIHHRIGHGRSDDGEEPVHSWAEDHRSLASPEGVQST